MTANYSIKAEQAAEELLNRRRARRDLLAYTEYTMPEFESSWHHNEISQALMKVEAGLSDRLILMAPPRHTKSELASRRLPAWYVGRNPTKQIITSTYAGEFATDFGRAVRGIVDSEEHRRVFPHSALSAHSKAANRWNTTEGGIYVAVGVGGPITGRGAHLALIDDPFKNREDSDSEARRESVWNWYTSTLRTRLMPGGAIVLVMTRWHEDDLAGRLIEKMEKEDGKKWDIVKLKAVNDKGEALWPKWYDREALDETRLEIGERDWNSLFQQEPVPDTGTFFMRDWFERNRYYLGDQPPTNKYQISDYAVSPDGGDFTELGIVGVDKISDLWVEDWWYGQSTADVWVEKQLEQIKKHDVLCSFGEKGVIRRAVEPLFRTMSRDAGVYPRLEWLTRTGDKVAMARAIQGMAASGKIHIPRTPWGDRLIEQLVTFPSGKNDDAVDALAILGMAMQSSHPAILQSETVDDVTRDCFGRPTEDGDSWRI